jgi:hypothetical protein
MRLVELQEIISRKGPTRNKYGQLTGKWAFGVEDMIKVNVELKTKLEGYLSAQQGKEKWH